jgi:hypothetical protein
VQRGWSIVVYNVCFSSCHLGIYWRALQTGDTMFTSTYALAALFGFAASQTVTYQAEDAVLSGTTVGTSVAGYTGKHLSCTLSNSTTDS